MAGTYFGINDDEFHDFDVEVHNDTLMIRGVNGAGCAYETAVSVLTIDRLPAKFHLWDNINNTNNILHPEQSIPCNHIISVTYLVGIQYSTTYSVNQP